VQELGGEFFIFFRWRRSQISDPALYALGKKPLKDQWRRTVGKHVDPVQGLGYGGEVEGDLPV
jgi:hypothetical protein